MNVIVCLDNNGGMAFNSRRQSMDRVVREKILKICANSKLYMDDYSYGQFDEKAQNIIVCDDFLKKASDDDFCFVERQSFSPDKVDKLYVFWWNRDYPSDVKIGFKIEDYFNSIKIEEFKGYSHEKITLEVFSRK